MDCKLAVMGGQVRDIIVQEREMDGQVSYMGGQNQGDLWHINDIWVVK
jgi:hypothetical protein